jgi:hypothetical protein
MSQPTTESGNQLNEIITRINALTKQRAASTTSPETAAIPRLTDIYDGDAPLNLVSSAQHGLPTLEDSVAQDNVAGRLTAAQQAQLMDEMQPLIKAAVKKALLHEIVALEKALKTTLEQDIMEMLKKRIQSGQY